MNNTPLQNGPVRKRGVRKIILVGTLAALTVVLSILAGYLAYQFAYRATAGVIQAHTAPESFSVVTQTTTESNELTQVTTLPSQEFRAPDPTLAPWDGVGRVTFLLLGLDYRDWEAGSEYSRSDTMILLTLDPLSREAGILSIPRDMWVAIPGFQHGKINTAYYLGDSYKLPGGGPGLSVDTVEHFLGVPINFYAQIDFGTFVRFIDEIGGVKIDVPEPITIDLLGSGRETKKTLQPGVQVLPGEWALAYARARNTDGGDFDRAERQQQVILAIRDRVLTLDTLQILIEKADSLYKDLASGIRTNITLDQAIKLALLASKVSKDDIERGVIDEGYILFGQTQDGLAILIPLIDKIHVLRDDIFADTTVLSPQSPGSTRERMINENAHVWVQNGSHTPGLAERTSEYLRTQGINIVQQSEAEESTTLTTIIIYTGKPHTGKYLVELMDISPYRINYEYNPLSDVDILIILGDDWARDNPIP